MAVLPRDTIYAAVMIICNGVVAFAFCWAVRTVSGLSASGLERGLPR